MATVQKLSNLRHMRRVWWANVARAFVNALGPMMAAVLISAYVYMWFFDSINGEFAAQYPGIVQWLSSLTYLSLVLLILPLVIVLSIPVVMFSAGPFPMQRYVEADATSNGTAEKSDELAEDGIQR
jgi:uncharacterized protein involved in cysteine biosynthesis